MALRDRLPFTLPFGNGPTPTAAANDPGTSDGFFGHTDAEPTPDAMPMPRIGGLPFGQSGRANFWGFPQPDELNRDLIGVAGLRRFNEMYRTDAHVRRLVLAAWAPIVAGTWTLEPYGGESTTDQDKQIADTIWWMLSEFMSPNFVEHLYQAGPLLLRSGYLPFEQLWTTVKDPKGSKTLLAPRKLDLRLPSSVWQWWQDDFGDLTHIGQILPNKANVVIPATDLVYYRLGAEGDNWQGTSLLRHAWKHWYLKDKLERIDAVGQERKAVGVPVVYPPTGATPKQKEQVEQLLANLHMSEAVYMMMPGPKAGSQGSNAVPQEEWLVEIIKFDSSSGSGIMESISYHQSAIAASFLTDFLELGHHQVGARATAEVQEDPFLTAVNGALLPPIVPPLNALIDRIRRLNWDSAEGSPTLKLTLHDEASLSEIAAYVVPLIQAEALQVDPELEDYLRDRGGLPPANADVRQQKQAAQEAGMQAAAAQLATRGETPNQEPPNPDAPVKPGQEPSGPAKPSPNPIAGAIKNTGKIPPAGKQLDQAPAPLAAGVILHAADTGRVLTVQRSPDDSDPPDVFGRYEFPGGKLDPADPTPWDGAVRELGEETGAKLGADVKPIGSFASPDGKYRAFVARIPYETDLEAGHDDKQEVANTVWQHPDSLTNGTMSPRAQRLLPGLHGVLGQHQLDAPLSGGVADESGLQMVPEAGTGQTCTCGVGPWNAEGVCAACGGTDLPDGMPSFPTRKLDSAPAEPTAKWFERLISQDRLREAFDGARDHIEAAVSPQATLMAQKLAHHAANGTTMDSSDPPQDLVDALTQHYTDMYQLGQQTVQAELAQQRAHLKLLDDPASPADAALGSRLARARARGEHSARNLLNAVQQRLGRDQITGLKDPAALQAAAQSAATAQLRQEALSNTAAMVNDGRYDAATSAGDVVGGVYTSVLDERACDPCIAADTGDVLPMADAASLGPPNPNCQGGDYCRCLILWVLTGDPAALQAIT